MRSIPAVVIVSGGELLRVADTVREFAVESFHRRQKSDKHVDLLVEFDLRKLQWGHARMFLVSGCRVQRSR